MMTWQVVDGSWRRPLRVVNGCVWPTPAPCLKEGTGGLVRQFASPALARSCAPAPAPALHRRHRRRGVHGSSPPFVAAMPSWDDSDSSSHSLLGEFVDMDYAPDTCEDPEFHGVALDSPEVCRLHGLAPQKCVTFEGTNTGRRFYMCQVGNQVMNCGFHSWIDKEEWPETMQRALSRLWGMYNEAHDGRINDRCDQAIMLKQLSEDKQKLQKKHDSLLDDVKKFVDETERKVILENYQKFKEERKESVAEQKKEEHTAARKNEIQVLKNAVAKLKEILKTQADVMKAKMQKCEDEKLALKDEKKKLEYMIFDLFNAKDSLQQKVKKIKAICDDE